MKKEIRNHAQVMRSNYYISKSIMYLCVIIAFVNCLILPETISISIYFMIFSIIFLIESNRVEDELNKIANQQPDTEIDTETEKEYEEFWKRIVEKNGKLDIGLVKRELYDFSKLIHSTMDVFDHITNGRITKPLTCVDAVLSEYENVVQELLEEAKKDIISDFASGAGLELQFFTNGTEKVIAYTIDDAIAVWEDTIGDIWSSYETSSSKWKPCNYEPKDIVSIKVERASLNAPGGARIEYLADNICRVTASAGLWIAYLGRCYFSSTES